MRPLTGRWTPRPDGAEVISLDQARARRQEQHARRQLYPALRHDVSVPVPLRDRHAVWPAHPGGDAA